VLDADAMVAALVERPSSTAMLCDFDGSLSAIVERPADAVPVPGVLEVLEALVARLGRVGIVSGRPVEFLVAQLPVRGLVYAGLYGMEHLLDGVRSLDPRVARHLPSVDAASAEAEARLPGILIERKAGVSVTIHWRLDPERADEAREVARDLARAHGLAELETRMAVELRPPVAIDKGDAATALVDGFACAAFAGDDSGDIAAFDALDRAARSGRLERVLRIGVVSPEMPPALLDAVDGVVDGPSGLLALLRRVAEEIREPG
jgi:trehalose 6-phosphate phosphatase